MATTKKPAAAPTAPKKKAAPAKKVVISVPKATKTTDTSEASNVKTKATRLAELANNSVSLARLVAGNTGTSAGLLLELSRHPDESVRKRVVGNPSAPAKAVMSAGSQFPEQLLENPSFDLYILEEPELLEGIGAAALRSLLKREFCPASFFSYAARQDDEATQLAVLTNSKAPILVVQSLLTSKYARVTAAASSHVALQSAATPGPDGWLEEFTENLLVEEQNRDKISDAHQSLAYLLLTQSGEISSLTEAERWVVRTAWTQADRKKNYPISASNSSCPVHLLELLAKDEDSDVRRAVAANPSCPEKLRISLLELLAKDEDSDVRSSVAENPSCPEKLRISLLELLAKDKDSDVRRGVAKNPSCPIHLLELLAKDKNSWVRRGVAKNPSCPIHLLELLAKDEDSDVRSSVAENPSCPEKLRISLLELLAKDKDSDVRRGVAKNPSCPIHLLELLAKDEDSDVRSSVAENPSCPEKLRISLLELLAKDEDSDVRSSVAENPSCPEKLRISLLELLAKDKDSWVRNRVAANPSCPIHLLELLAKDKESYVRLSVAKNPSCPIHLLELLAKDKDSWVRGSVAKNPSCPKHLVERIFVTAVDWVYFNRIPDEITTTDFLHQLELGEEVINRIVAAKQRGDLLGLRREFIERMVSGSKPSITRLVAFLLDDCPPSALAKYQRSSWWIERSAIAQNPQVPESILKRLLGDAHASVQKAALWRQGQARAQLIEPAMQKSIDTSESETVVSTSWAAEFEAALAFKDATLIGGTEQVVMRAHQALAYLIWDRQRLGQSTSKEEIRLVDGAERQNSSTISANPSCPVHLLELLAKDKDSDVRRGVAKNPSCPIHLLELLAKDKDSDVRRGVAKNPSCPIHLLELLAKDENSWVRLSVAENPSCPEKLRISLLELLAKDEDSDVRNRVAANPSCPIHLLELLAKDKDSDVVRRGVAKNPSCPIHLLELLAKDKDSWVRGSVAKNPSCPVHLLELLAKDEDSDVRSSVAENPSCPEKLRISLLELLAKDKDSDVVRRGVAKNPSCPIHLLELLAKDENSWVRSSVAENPSCPVTLLELLAKDEDSWVRYGVAVNPSCPVTLLEHLAKDQDSWVRRGVAANPSCPETLRISLLELLAKDQDSWVRLGVVANPSCPEKLRTTLLELVAKDEDNGDGREDTKVRDSVAGDINTPGQILGYLLTEPKKVEYSDVVKIKSVLQSPEKLLELRADYLKKLCAGLNPSFSRVYGLLLSDCPPAALTKCAKSSLWLERCAVAQNPMTPAKILHVLAKDSNAVVAAAAQRA